MTATGFDGAVFLAPESEPHPRAVREPRNYLAAAERRKLFWLIMPPAIMVMVTLELFLRPLWETPPPPREPQVDTRLAVVTGPPPAEGAVVILPDDEVPEGVDETLLGASAETLSGVRDATFFGMRDRDAWCEIVQSLQQPRARSKPQDVGFTEIFSQPRSFRGHEVRMRGTLRRLEKLETMTNTAGIEHYWQGWLEPAGGPASPVVVHFLQLPEGMPDGMEITEPVVVTGFFLKNMAYRAADGVRLAPLLVSLEPDRPAGRSSEGGLGEGFWDRSIVLLGGVTMLGVVAAIGIGSLVVGRGRRRKPETDTLDPALSNVETFSVSESLRKLATADAFGGEDKAGGAHDE